MKRALRFLPVVLAGLATIGCHRKVRDPEPPGSDEALPHGALAGRVTDPEGRPAAGVDICARLRSDRVGTEIAKIPRCAASGPDGGYRIEDLLPGAYEIGPASSLRPAELQTRVLAAGRVRNGVDLALARESTQRALERETPPLAGSTLEGRVIEGGHPVAGCAVRARPATPFSSPQGIPIAVTDAEGRYRFRALEAGAYQPLAACAVHRGLARDSVELAAGASVKDVVVETARAAYVRGRVLRRDDRACEGARVRLVDETKQEVRDAIAGEEGDVLLEALAPGTYNARIDCEGTWTVSSELAIVVDRAPVTGIVWRAGGTLASEHDGGPR